MKILIACYPRVGNRYFLKSLQQASKEHWSFATHDRNLTHLYHDKYQMIQNFVIALQMEGYGPEQQKKQKEKPNIISFPIAVQEDNSFLMKFA